MDLSENILKGYHELIRHCQATCEAGSVPEIRKAFEFAYNVIGDSNFEHGESILNHALEVAFIIATEIELGSDSVIAGLLHNVLYANLKQKVQPEEIKENFGNAVFTILNGMFKINALGTDTVDLHAENYRSLLLALAGDVRVIILKIADRLQVMRNLDNYQNEIRGRLVNETSFLYAPLAHRLGLYNINSELLDLSLKYQKPKNYDYVVARLKETEKERANFVADFVKPIEEKLKKRGFDFNMKARTKSIHSIWNKMKSKKVSFDEVYDLFAIRIILNSSPENEKSECWTVYSIVTEEYQANPERLRDWITIPKSNGYESLHTTVLGPRGKWVEVQIRTGRMDEVAEKGLAAHWRYKGGKGSQEFDNWLTGIREILENPELNIVDFIDEFKVNVYKDEIFVFTPKGDLKKLPRGSTLLDFAYDIHSDLGDKCVGGRVNDKKVGLRHKLENGDHISIETSNNQKPKIDWLDFVVTSKAKNKIRVSLNEEQKREAQNGKEILLRKCKNWKIELDDDAIRKLLKHYKFKLASELYFNVSKEKIDVLEVKSLLSTKVEESGKARLEEILTKDESKNLSFDSSDEYLIIDNKLNNVIYKLAPCCNPVFGDTIFGFVTINDGIKIHRKNCPNATQMINRFPYRVVNARWKGTTVKSSFLATLFVTGTDHEGILSDITHIIAKDVGSQLRSVNIESNKGTFEGVLKISVYNLQHLDFLIHKIKNTKGVLSVTRGDK
ncbi:MAG: bifunctional (p)ppGpp synthetase/guanosine-3',5'-bis(diphosphate) 3'-pyrophosphohydrolase [Prolixibacteraceae bacterium]|nr:bifunctional (p)ppGpp synthetase/guanosine-3',5'-bis(diphosphate) 3'-pyrophosphohydrolase [Prolixibacteraceae bacterium]MBN2774684.1 bifunctional (p)ppGpp synthetase/guanosine-3',5'-bis(diphosphate) 3'-pyrophosphohydrolase [Prolixibacteraceae bacterium]